MKLATKIALLGSALAFGVGMTHAVSRDLDLKDQAAPVAVAAPAPAPAPPYVEPTTKPAAQTANPWNALRKGQFVTDEPWDSAHNKETVEIALKKNFKLQLTGAPQSVSSASCKATSTQNIWKCGIRFLGQSEIINYRMESNPENGQIAGNPEI